MGNKPKLDFILTPCYYENVIKNEAGGRFVNENKINLSERFKVVYDTSSDKVKRAIDLATEKEVCIKRWDKDDVCGVNEVKVLSTLSHDYIPKFVCCFEEGEYRYLVSEWIDSVTLEEYIKEKGGITEKECIDLGLLLCDVIRYLHTHGEGPYAFVDLKPSNILVDGNLKQVWICDFEAAFHIANNAVNIEDYTTKVLGTEIYSAPEVLYGKPLLLSDIYSIGAVLLYALSGKPPVNRKRLKEYGSLGKLIERCMKFEPEDRVSEIEALKRELLSLKEEENKVRVTINTKINTIKDLKRYKRIVVTVDGNMGFACELAYIAATEFNYKTAIFELSESDNIIAYYLSSDAKGNASYVSEYDIFSLNYGMKTYLSRNSREWIKRGLLRGFELNTNLYVARSGIFDELEISDVRDVRNFCFWAYNNFDLVIIAAEGRLTSPVKNALMLNSDYVIAVPYANVDDIQLTCAYYNRLSRKGYISEDSVRYVAWDYIDKVSLPESGISMIVGRNRYLGAIPFDRRRLVSRNVKGSLYIKDDVRDITHSYDVVLSKLMSGGGEY